MYVSLCDGSPIDLAVNPAPAFLYDTVSLDDVLISAKRVVSLIAPSKIRIALTYVISQQVLLQYDNVGFGGQQQRFYSRDYAYRFTFEDDLTNCLGQLITAPSAAEIGIPGVPPLIGVGKNWDLGNPDPDLGPLTISNSDFTVSVQMP